MKLSLNGRQIRKNVRMVVFEIVDDQRLRPIVDKLGASIEIRGVVLVRFDHKRRGFRRAG